ncbi:Class II abasic (AP) endonuclease [Mortierella polycephala]|uniref:DNA-(apurinic or apyrimidinic site) endonuclease n=1 Tax=Mortierella polycephala TaxID=41804 RepID=A0A9P6PPH8_9FUNG|nr:Class II abasic (AP) endonuclease [Mortierella polycephala]
MKFMTWNVNGIRALTNYHPYCDDLHKNYKEILDYLDADVICLQETKITRSKLDTDIALVPGYDSYWSFHRTKSGYSGVVIYVKDHIKLLATEEGISGVLSGNISVPSPKPSNGSTSITLENSNKKRVGGYPTLEGESTAVHTRFQELDTEGRGLILDFGFFVLFNLYCPNETDETRLPFKMDYYHLLEARVRELIKEGREVIVMGDMNVVPTELDHCDPGKWKKESGRTEFTDTPPRQWFNSFLAPQGPLTDLYRVFHEGEAGAFTCWNTKIEARPSNYGTRLDYILVSKGLVPWFKSCDRKPDVMGSDHCPVVAEMYTELTLEKSQQEMAQDRHNAVQRLQDILDSYEGSTDHPLAAKYFDEFSGKQQKLSAFFKKPSQPSLSTPASLSPSIPAPIASSVMAQIGLSSKRSVDQLDMDSLGSRKKPFFSAEQTATAPTSAPSIEPMTQQIAFNSIPKPINKSSPKTNSGRQEKGVSKKSTPTKPGGQQTMLSFLSTTSKKASMDTGIIPSTEVEIAEQASNQANVSQTSTAPTTPSSSSYSQPESTNPSATYTFSPNDFAAWIPGSQDTLEFSTNDESTTSRWQSLFTKRPIPKCRIHNEPCTEHTVNKKGPNKGRRFFSCSLPVGPEGDTVGTNPKYRCNFFEWLNPERKK